MIDTQPQTTCMINDERAEFSQPETRRHYYFRMNVVRNQKPDLEHRSTEIPQESDFSLEDAEANGDVLRKELDRSEVLLQPSNVSDNVFHLANCPENIVILSNGNGLTFKEGPTPANNKSPAPDCLADLPLAGHSLAELERETIQQTLAHNKGNRRRSAAVLGISVRTLQRKLKVWENAVS